MEYYAASKHYVFNEYSMTWVKSYVWCLVKVDTLIPFLKQNKYLEVKQEGNMPQCWQWLLLVDSINSF